MKISLLFSFFLGLRLPLPCGRPPAWFGSDVLPHAGLGATPEDSRWQLFNNLTKMMRRRRGVTAQNVLKQLKLIEMNTF